MITQTETGLSTPNYNNLKAAKQDFTKELTAYRYNPAFDTYLGRVTRDPKLPWSIAADDTIIVRAYNDGGTVYAESFTHASSVWTSPATIATAQFPGVAPKVVKNGSTWEIYVINSLGYVYRSTSSDGITWAAALVYSSIQITDTPVFLSVALGPVPLVYVVVQDATTSSYTILALSASVQYNTGITWASKIYEFDAIDFKAAPDDTTGTHSNSETRHCLVASALLPMSFVYKTIDGAAVKQAQLTGGVISWIIRPPNGGRAIQASRWYPVQTFDQWDDNLQARKSAKLMATNSTLDGSNSHDTIWLTAVAVDGDVNIDQSFSTISVAYYSTRDGKHWSQDRLIPLSGSLGIDNGDFRSAAIVRHGTYLYLASVTVMVQSLGCLEFNNPHASLILDLTSNVVEYYTTLADVRSSRITLDNTDANLWATFLGQSGVVALVTKIGHPSMVQVSIEEVDNISPNRERPAEYIELTTRDQLSWMLDRSESAHAVQWDSQLSALDTFTAINGVDDSGLAYTDTVKGVFGTANNTLIAKLKYQENIAFHTTGSGRVQDGACASIFEMPTPTSFGGTNSTDSPTYIGVLFRAQDKDNFWACWYNYWTGKIELVERSSGVDTIRAAFTPTSAFTTRANLANTVGIRVEFKGATVKIYESTILYSAKGARYNPSYTYMVPKTSKSMLMGYVGYISCAYSDQDQGDVTDPGPIITVDTGSGSPWGVRDTFLPSRYYSLDIDGYFFYGSGALGSPTWTDLSPSGAIQTALAGSAPLRGGSPTSQWDFIVDPFHMHRMIIFGYEGLAINDSVHANPWTLSSHAPLTGGYWNFFHQYPDFGVSGDIVSSINWEGYFGWLETNTPSYYVYTYDNFATIHRTALSGSPTSISISQRATNWTNIYVVVSGFGGSLQESTDGGQTFTNKTLPSPVGSIDPNSFYGVNVPYSLGGGAANTTNKIVTYYSVDRSIHNGQGFYDLSGTWRSFTSSGTNGGRSRNVNTLTVDGNHINIRSDGWVHRSSDGGASWVLAPNGGDSGFPFYGSRLNGWPTNPDVGIMPDRRATITLDGFATTFSLNPGGRGTHICNLIADLTEVYDLGGVH